MFYGHGAFLGHSWDLTINYRLPSVFIYELISICIHWYATKSHHIRLHINQTTPNQQLSLKMKYLIAVKRWFLLCLCFFYLRTAQVYCFAFFWHVDTRPISPFLSSLIYFLFMYNHCHFFTWCIRYINWSCLQSYITLSVLMFLWYRQKFLISLYGTRVPWVNMGRGQPGSVSKFPPFLWVKLWVGWVGRGYTAISRYFPASWINWVTLFTKIKLLYSLRF